MTLTLPIQICPKGWQSDPVSGWIGDLRLSREETEAVVRAVNEREELHERLLLIAELAKPQSRDIAGLCDTLQDICVIALKPPVKYRVLLKEQG